MKLKVVPQSQHESSPAFFGGQLAQLTRRPDEHAQQPPLKLKVVPQHRRSVDLLDTSWPTNMQEVSSPGIMEETPIKEDGLGSGINSATFESDPFGSSLLSASPTSLHKEHTTHKIATPVPSAMRDSSSVDDDGTASTPTPLPATQVLSHPSEPLCDLTDSPGLCQFIDLVIDHAADSAT